jgi:hypothetical protein
MRIAARAFLDSLAPTEHDRVVHPDLGDPARTWWSNLPAAMYGRPGVAIDELKDDQRMLLHDLLRASTSSQGYHKLTGGIRSDDVLHQLRDRPTFGPGIYFVAIFGSPANPNWAWMLTGHHMNAIFTVAGERTGFTPMFTGAQPVRVPSGVYAGWHVLPQDADRANELLATLSEDQRRIADLGGEPPYDVVAGPGRQSVVTSFQGIPATKLDAGQNRLLWLVVQEFVGNAEFDAAEAQLALIRDGWADTHFCWQGPPADPTTRFYFRVHGPRILIEYDVVEPVAINGGHVHAIIRDPVNDYGMDWLGLHYRESADHRPATR